MTQQDSARHAWAVFLTAHAMLVEAVEARLAKAVLPPLAWYDVLWALERAGDGRRRMHELADRVVLSRSNLTPEFFSDHADTEYAYGLWKALPDAAREDARTTPYP